MGLWTWSDLVLRLRFGPPSWSQEEGIAQQRQPDEGNAACPEPF